MHKLNQISPLFDFRHSVGRKQPRQNAWEVRFSANGINNPALAELRASNGTSGKLLDTLRREFSIVRFTGGCADLSAGFIITP